MANKYLDKIELEPGVTWDRKKKVLTATSAKKQEMVDKRIHSVSLLTAGPYAALGGFIGYHGGRVRLHRLGKLAEPLGAAIGAGVAGGGMYGLFRAGSNSPLERRSYVENAMSDLEQKHERTIDRIEGWD